MSTADIELMRRIKALRLEHLFADFRLVRNPLRQGGYEFGRMHVTAMMRRRGSRGAISQVRHEPKPSRTSDLYVSVTVMYRNQKKATYLLLHHQIGTEGRNRTDTGSLPPDFESGASTSSATPA